MTTYPVLEAAAALVREAAERRPGEQQSAAIERTARIIGVSVRLTKSLYYGEFENVSVETASTVLARRTAIEDEQLEHLAAVVRESQERARQLIAKREGRAPTECSVSSGSRPTSESGSLSWHTAALFGSASWLVGSRDDDDAACAGGAGA